jgi:nanoRNase/pAp phosphatase (c-di-AMP/oligoRNAs hydrolase)
MVAEVADFLLRLDQVEWAAALGIYQRQLYCSIRTTDRDANAGEILQRVLGGKSAGGHDMIAGGRVAIAGDPRLRQQAVAGVRDRLLAELGIAAVGQPLV